MTGTECVCVKGCLKKGEGREKREKGGREREEREEKKNGWTKKKGERGKQTK